MMKVKQDINADGTGYITVYPILEDLSVKVEIWASHTKALNEAEIGINWSAMGTMPVAFAKQYAAAIKHACWIAEVWEEAITKPKTRRFIELESGKKGLAIVSDWELTQQDWDNYWENSRRRRENLGRNG